MDSLAGEWQGLPISPSGGVLAQLSPQGGPTCALSRPSKIGTSNLYLRDVKTDLPARTAYGIYNLLGGLSRSESSDINDEVE